MKLRLVKSPSCLAPLRMISYWKRSGNVRLDSDMQGPKDSKSDGEIDVPVFAASLQCMSLVLQHLGANACRSVCDTLVRTHAASWEKQGKLQPHRLLLDLDKPRLLANLLKG